MRLPFSKKQKQKGKYSLIDDPDISDSGTEEEAIIFEKKFGHVELNLVPRQPRRKTAKKTNCVRTACLVLAIAVILGSVILLGVYFYTSKSAVTNNKTVLNTTASISNTSVINNSSEISLSQHIHLNIQPTSKTATPTEEVKTVGTAETRNWNKTFKHSGGEGGLRLFDVDGDGLDDIIFGTAGSDLIADVLDVVGSKFDDLHRYCNLKGLDYPCVGSVVALRGLDGEELWRFHTRSEVFLTVCDIDLNKDGLLDCIGTGRQSQCVAFDPRKGEVLWTVENDNFLAADWNTYQALALQDWDKDGVRDILIVNGGDPRKDPQDHNRTAGRAVMVSGQTGVPLGSRYLELPDSKESYMSPVLYTPADGSAPYVLFGSGGETVPGDLLAITEEDLCVYIMESDTSNCPHYEGEPLWAHMQKQQNGFIKIFSGKIKGVMVPPVIVDVNKDGVQDLVLSAYDGIVSLLDGKSLEPLWTAEFTGMESYSSPAPGYFDDDDILDFMLHWCDGAWDTYTGSNATVISGKDGSVIWTMGSAFMQMSSGLSLKTNQHNQDMFLFRVQGRDSLFSWDKEGKVNRKNGLQRKKRHGGDSFKDPDADKSIEDLMNSNHSFSDALRISFSQKHLTCEDDLSSFKGEVFLMNGAISNNPIRVQELPVQKYHYDVPNGDADAERDRIMKILYPNKYGDIPLSNSKTHMSGMITGENNDIVGGDNLDSGVHEVGGTPDDAEDGNIDKGVNNVGSTTDADADGVPLGSGSPADANGDSPGSGSSNADGADQHGPRRRRRDGDVVDDSRQTPQKLCTVAYYDARTTGAVGDLDGDGLLDYVSVLALMVPLFDEGFSYRSLDYQTVIHKVSLETGLKDGNLKSVEVHAKTELKDSGIPTKFDGDSRIFRPMTEQTWAAFMGKTGSSVYNQKSGE